MPLIDEALLPYNPMYQPVFLVAPRDGLGLGPYDNAVPLGIDHRGPRSLRRSHRCTRSAAIRFTERWQAGGGESRAN
jgi:hypothetical protein